MVPMKNSPQWSKFIDTLGSIPVTHLATRMLMTRLKMKLKMENDSPDARLQAISEAFDFFTQNQNTVQSDIKLIFG